MKKKQIITILSVVFALSMLFAAFTGCNKGKHKFSDEWKFDETAHWHECMTKKHTDTSEKISHDFNDGVVTTQPTEEAEGVKTFTCNTCGYKKTKKVAKLAHTHKFDKTKWKYDDKEHWHEATCEHKTERDSVAPHNLDDGVITKEPNYGVVGEKTFTCTVCKYSKTEEIPALAAKDNTISFANDLVEEKTYDGLAFSIDTNKVNRKGNGEITITYMGENDTAFTATAPTNAGEYTVKATVKGTAEWKGGEITKTITINKREVTLPKDVFERKFGDKLESGKFGLTCINVKEVTNNVVEWVTVCVPETYYAIGIHTIGFISLTVDNDNFELIRGAYNAVRFTVWNAPDSFYAGIQDVFTLSGSGEVIITTKIANGTLKKGDQILVNEIGKIITVKKIKNGTGSSAIDVETATAGDEVGFYIDGATKAELKGGYMLSKPDTIIGYSNVTVTIRAFTKGEGGQNTPIQTGIKPNVAFADTFGEVIGKATFPEGTTLLSAGEMLEGVTIDFQGKKVPAFVGRRFTLRSGGKTIAECIVTAVPHATRVNCTVSAPTGKTAVIEPIQSGENTFMLNLNRSSALENIVDSEAIDLVVKYNGVIVGSYKRTGLGVGEGDLAHVENGGTLSGSYININLAKSVAGLTDADGNWICDKANVTFDVSATLTEQLDNLGVGSVGTITLGADEVKYFTLNELEHLPSGWYSFVNALYTSGSVYNINHYSVYTDAGTKVDMMSDMFMSNGGKYYVKYTTRKALTDESVGFKAAKAELTATNTTSNFTIPSGKKGDRLVIKVTLNKAVSYFHTNTVTFQGKVPAFNATVVKVFYDNYQAYNGGYQSLSTGDWFYLPTNNAEQMYVYIMMEYYNDLEGTATLKFSHSAAGVQMLNSEFQTITFKPGASMKFIFNATETVQYKIEMAETGSNVLIPPTTISVDKVYDPNFAAVNIIGNVRFNANAKGYYSLILKNMTDSAQTVRIRVVKAS